MVWTDGLSISAVGGGMGRRGRGDFLRARQPGGGGVMEWANQEWLRHVMGCLAEGRTEEALREVDEWERTHGVGDITRFLRAQALLRIAQARDGSAAERWLRQAARETLAIEHADDPSGVLGRMRRELALALCQHAVRFVCAAPADGTGIRDTLRWLQGTAKPLVHLALRLTPADPEVMECLRLLEGLIARYTEFDALPGRGAEWESALNE